MKYSIRFLVLLLALAFLFPRSSKGVGNDNPTGAAGQFNGNITTGGSYDPYTGNAMRVVDDMVVQGSVGAYPLKWTRVINTRTATGWSSCYGWTMSVRSPSEPTHWNDEDPGYEGADAWVHYPDGRIVEFWGQPGDGYGAFESVDTHVQLEDLEHQNYDLVRSDGGRVTFRAIPLGPNGNGIQQYSNPRATSIIDPYGQVTLLNRDPYPGNRLRTITEPGGRYLEITYATIPVQGLDPVTVIDYVRAYDGRGNLIQTVNYDYDQLVFHDRTGLYLTRVYYDDGTQATYTYRQSNATHPNSAIYRGMIETCRDVRFDGAMKNIEYEYMPPGLKVGYGQIKAEKNANTHQIVSEIIYPEWTGNLDWDDPLPYRRTEKRGDNAQATRVFQYSVWPEVPETYTDFESPNHVTSTAYVYDPIVNYRSYKIVTDALQKQTTIERQMVPVLAVLSVKYHDNSQVIFTYTDPAHPFYLASRRDENEKTTSYTRNAVTHQIERIDHPDGGIEIFTYDSSNPFGQVFTHQMTSGGTENFRYDNRGLKTLSWPPATESDQSPQNHPTQYFYYQTGAHTDRLHYVVDPRGFATWYEYNGRGLVTKVTHEYGVFESKYYGDGTLEWTKDELGHVTSYLYDEYKRVTKVTNHLNESTTTSYDPDPGPTVDLSLTHTASSVYRTTSPMNSATTYDYDRNFRRKWMKQAPESTNDVALTQFTYDAVGNLLTVQDPRLKVTSFGYDHRHRQTWSRNDELNETTEFGYDPAGNKIREKRPDGVFRSWDHDEMNRIWHAYDWRSNEVPRLDQTTTYERDPAGNALFITDAKGAVYDFVYDDLNRKASAIYPIDANNQRRTETWHYDYAGNIDLYKNPAGQQKHMEYDNQNRAWHSWWNGGAAVGQEIVTKYDGASRVEWIETRENGNMVTRVAFGYDDANRKIWEDQTLAGQPTRRVKTDLDEDGRRENLQIVDPAQGGGGGIFSPEMTGSGLYSISYTYTGRNQLKQISGEDWGFNYLYDPSGNRTSRQAVYNGVSSTVQCPSPNYDALNRPTKWEQSGPNGFQALSHYRYDRANREEATWREEENNLGEHFVYEATNQLKRVSYKGAIPSPSPTPIPTPPNGTPTPTAPPSQQVEQVEFAESGHYPNPILLALTTNTAGATILCTSNDTGYVPPTHTNGTPTGSTFVYISPLSVPQGATQYVQAIAYKAGMIDSVVTEWTVYNSMAPGAQQRIVTYNYTADKLNRTSVSDTTAGQTLYTPNALNQYTNVGGLAYNYDTKFNLTWAAGFSAVYDAANRMVAASNSTTSVNADVELVYDGLGRCVKRTIAGAVTVFIYDGWKAIAEWDESVPEYFRAWNVYGPGADELLLRHAAKMGYTRYHSDANGNVTFLLDNDGQLVEKYTYDVFGRPKITDKYGSPRDFTHWDNRFLFQGREYLAEIGVYDYRNRFYHPDLGRFLQIDPTGFDAGDMNLFRYCNDDPIDGSDPTGLYDVGFEGYGKPPTSTGGATKDTMGNMALRDAMDARGGRSFGRELGGQRKALAEVKRQLARNPNEPINVTGYSRGGEAAIRFCNTLRKEGISVAHLTLIDTVKKLGNSLRNLIGGRQNHTVPSNVKQADNYYQRNRSPYAGGVIINESAQYRNHDMTDQGVTHNTIVREALKQQSTAPPPEMPKQSDFLDFMLDGGSGTAGVSGAPRVVRSL